MTPLSSVAAAQWSWARSLRGLAVREAGALGGVVSAAPSAMLTSASDPVKLGALAGQMVFCTRASNVKPRGTPKAKSPLTAFVPVDLSDMICSGAVDDVLVVRVSAHTVVADVLSVASARAPLAPVATPLWMTNPSVASAMVPYMSSTVTGGTVALFCVMPLPPPTGCSDTRM